MPLAGTVTPVGRILAVLTPSDLPASGRGINGLDTMIFSILAEIRRSKSVSKTTF